MRLFANVITSIFHPVTVTIPGVFLIVYISTGDINKAIYWTLLSMVFSSLIALFVLLGVRNGFFNNLDVSNRKQRVVLYPFVVGVVILFVLFVKWLHGPSALILASILFICALVILDLINTKIKASVHVAAVSSLVVGIIFLYGGLTYFLILLIPLVAWARIKEKRHSLKETVIGALSGVLLSSCAILIVRFIV